MSYFRCNIELLNSSKEHMEKSKKTPETSPPGENELINKEAEDTKFIRHPKSLTRNVGLIYETETLSLEIPRVDSRQVSLHLMIYLSKRLKDEDMFGYVRIDPADFGTAFKYSRASLFTKLDPELSKKVKVVQSDEFYSLENVFEHILHNLASSNIPIANRVNHPDGSYDNEIKYIQILDEIKIGFGKNNNVNNRKKVYYVKVNDNLKREILSRYTLLNTELVPELKKPKLDSLYIYLESLRHDLFAKEFYKIKDKLHEYISVGKSLKLYASPPFDRMVAAAQINISKISDRKHKLIKKLNALLEREEINELLGFSYDFRLKDEKSKYEYQPVICFEYNMAFLTRQKEERDKQHRLFHEYYQKDLFQKYFKHYGKKASKKGFDTWANQKHKDTALKRDIYVNAYKRVYKNDEPKKSLLDKLFPLMGKDANQ